MKVEDGGIVRYASDGTGEDSGALSSALAAGRMIKGTLASSLEEASDGVEGAHRRVASAACLGAYGGLALWAINRLTVGSKPAGEAALVVAGVSLGLLSKP